MKIKKILITIDWFLPGGLSGGPVRSYANLIEHLNDGFEFYILTRNTDYGLVEPYKNIVPNTWVSYNAYTKIYYVSNDQLNKKHLKRVINQTEFDIAYINGIYSWYFSILPIVLLKNSKKPVIVSARGMLNPQAFSVKSLKKKIFLKAAKIFGLYNKVRFHATNIDEANHIKTLIGYYVKINVAPNLPRKQKSENNLLKTKNEHVRFVNIARIAVEKGTLTMLKALQCIKEPLIIDLFGPIYDTDYWEQCQAVIKQLPEFIKVTYKGVLESENVPKTLESYDFFVLFSEGENFGHAILEALSVGLPVLISNRTPWKNLEKQHLGWDIDITNQDELIKNINIALKMPDEVYVKWSQEAFMHAKAFIENPSVLKQNKALFLN